MGGEPGAGGRRISAGVYSGKALHFSAPSPLQLPPLHCSQSSPLSFGASYCKSVGQSRPRLIENQRGGLPANTQGIWGDFPSIRFGFKFKTETNTPDTSNWGPSYQSRILSGLKGSILQLIKEPESNLIFISCS